MDKSKMMMIIIIALLVLLLGTVVGVGVWLINSAPAEGDWGPSEAVTTEPVLTPSELRLISLDSMTVNLAEGPNQRSDNLIVEVVIGLNESSTVDSRELEEIYDTINNSIHVARSVVISVFLDRTYDEVRTLEGKEESAEILRRRLQREFDSNLIVDVRFSQWSAHRGR